MPSRRRPELRALGAVALVVAAFAAAAYLAVRGSDGPGTRAGRPTWQGLVGDTHPAVSTELRQIVVLKTPAVAQRIAKVHYATEEDERRWAAQAFAVQQQVLTLLAARGLGVRPDYSYARVIDGFS